MAQKHGIPHVDDPVDHATLILDAQQCIVAASSQLLAFFQVSSAELVGRSIAEFLPFMTLVSEFRDRRYPRGEHTRMRLSREQTVVHRPDGTEIPVTVSLFETKESGNILLWLRHLHGEGEYCPLPSHKPHRAEETRL